MASGNFVTGATNFYMLSGTWASGNILTSATGKSVSTWDTNEVLVAVATSRTTNSSNWIQFGSITMTEDTNNNVNYRIWVGNSSNITATTGVTQTMNAANAYTYQANTTNVTFGVKSTASGILAFKRSNGTTYGTITDSHSNSWDGDLRASINYFTAPAQVTGLTATTAGTTSINLSWTAPNNGGTAILGYRILYSSDNWVTTNTITDYEANTATAQTITGLAAATTYKFVVSAHSAMTSNLRTVKSITNATGPYSAEASALTLAGGARFAGSVKTTITTAKRFNGTSWVDLTIRKRFNGTSWIDLSNS
jgi:hypothetical protein